MPRTEYAAVLLVFLTLHHSCTEGHSDVKYDGPRPVTKAGLEPLDSNGLAPKDPHSDETDIQLDHFMPFEHYLPKRQAPTNSTVHDNHIYYTSRFVPPGPEADALWVDLTQLNGVEEDLVHNLSGLYRYFDVHELMFDFPYYGHTINSVAITTAGFIYAGTFLHQSIHLTQYIAPLQADFNPGLNESATVLVYSNEDNFTIQWDRVHNHDHVSNGTFTFQLTLFKTGVIHFVYREVPLLVSEISDENHPVEVGLSDAFYVDVLLEGSGGPSILRTIYEYHRIRLNASNDLAYSAYIITPLPNCIMASTCDECVSVSGSTPFECGWCDTLNRCSDGIDRHRQDWFFSGCAFTNTQQCGAPTTATTTEATTTVATPTTGAMSTTSATTSATTTTMASSTMTTTTKSTETNSPIVNPGNMQQTGNQLSMGTITAVSIVIVLVGLLLVILTTLVIGVLIFGYKHPTSRVGQAMIKYRPKARSLNKVSASYNVESGKAILT